MIDSLWQFVWYHLSETFFRQKKTTPTHPEGIFQMVLSHNKSAASLRWDRNMFLRVAVYFILWESSTVCLGYTIGPACNLEIN